MVTNLSILNSGDKARHYSVATGNGAPAASDVIVMDVKTFSVGSQYTDLTNKHFYVRMAVAGAVTDWQKIGGAE